MKRLRFPVAPVRLALASLLALGLLLAPAPAQAKHKAHGGTHTSLHQRFGEPYRLGAPPPPARKHRSIAKVRASSDAANDDGKPAAAGKLPILTREEILASDSTRLARIGQHIIAGFYDFSDAKALVEKKAIAGIFITSHNVAGRTAASVRSDIDALQDIRKTQGMPPLIVAADQEGGQVSRLSPPLKRQPSLARALAGAKDDETRRKVVEDYASLQAAELKRIGVTVNFGPVVDLNNAATERDDGETKLRQRAIAADPYAVAKAAGWYCGTLAKAGLMCTLKHFPGLGRVARDTHVASGDITATEGQLELNDWVPFRRLMDRPNVATMLGHVRVGVIDKDTPASYSQTIIGHLIRQTWESDGLLITDDFSMGAVTGGKDGIGGASVKAVNAGADLILVSFSERHLDTVFSALIRADEDGDLDQKLGEISSARIARILAGTKAAAEN